jgi:hypothetical protein
MTCPNCGDSMAGRSFSRPYGGATELDLCRACRIIWFDDRELLQLAPAATLQLLSDLADEGDAPHRPLAFVLSCPRCERQLVEVHDQQRNTRFTYWRCQAGHGRLLTFHQFMRAKNFVRPLGPEEVDELRRRIRQVNCANCGAPADIEQHAVCRHCGTAFAILDPDQVRKTVAELKAAAEPGGAVDPALPLALAAERERAERDWAALDPSRTPAGLAATLMEAGRDPILGGLRACLSILGVR